MTKYVFASFSIDYFQVFFVFVCICYHSRHSTCNTSPCRQARRAYARHRLVVWSGCLMSCRRGGPTLPTKLFLAWLTNLFNHFSYHASKSHFVQRLSPKGLKMEASKQLKITKVWKNQYQNAPTIKTCKNTVSGNGNPLKMMAIKHFELFVQRSTHLNLTSKLIPKWSRRAPKITKKS